MKYLVTVSLIVLSSLTQAQSVNRNWKSELEKGINEFKSCENTSSSGISSCNAFIGESLKTIYRLNDFYAVSDGRYMLVSEIHDFLQNSSRWTLIGKGYEQDALAKAQQLANQSKAVVAVYLNEDNIGHLAYILPGSLQPSGSWGFKVPNSAAYFMSQPEKSYVNKGLSYSFPRSAISEVQLYVRKY